MENEYLTTRQVAEILHVKEETVTSYIRRKRDPLPAKRPGKFYLIKREDLEAWLERQDKNS